VGETSPLNYFFNMEFRKKTLRESLRMDENGVKTFSEKPQNIIMSESQLERLIENIQSKK